MIAAKRHKKYKKDFYRSFLQILRLFAAIFPVFDYPKPELKSAQFPFQNLACRRHRQAVAELDEARIFVTRHIRFAPFNHFVFGCCRACFFNDKRFDFFAVFITWNAYDGA